MINLLSFSRIRYHEFSVYKFVHTSTMSCSIHVHVYIVYKYISVYKYIHVVLITSRIK